MSEVQWAGEVDEKVYVYCMEMTWWGLGEINLISVANGMQFFPNMQQFFPAHLMEYQLSQMADERYAQLKAVNRPLISYICIKLCKVFDSTEWILMVTQT